MGLECWISFPPLPLVVCHSSFRIVMASRAACPEDPLFGRRVDEEHDEESGLQAGLGQVHQAGRGHPAEHALSNRQGSHSDCLGQWKMDIEELDKQESLENKTRN